MTFSARPELDAVPLAVHGGLDVTELRRLGIDPESVLDFSTNVNPFAPQPPPFAGDLRRYPDDRCSELRALVAAQHAIGEDRLAFGNGAAELIHLLCFAFVRPGDRGVVLAPTYGDYARGLRAAGAAVETVLALEQQAFRHEFDAIDAAVGRAQARILFVCTPNNPTGVVLSAEVIARVAARHPQTLVVVDESYADLSTQDESTALEVARERDNVVSLRSLTKCYALAGARLGYLAASRVVVEAVERVRPSWNVNAFAQHAGAWCLRERERFTRAVALLREAATALHRMATQAGLAIRPSASTFFLIGVGDARSVRAQLLRRGILVRDCTSFGLPAYVRAGARAEAESERLVAALAELSR